MALSNEKIKHIKLGYVITWSAGLLWATFPGLFSGSYDFRLSSMDVYKLRSSYIFPLLTVFMLYLWDVVYESVKEEAKTGKFAGFSYQLICIVFFIACFLFSISVDCEFVAGACFVGSWISMTAMKFMTTETIQESRCTSKGKFISDK